MRQDAAFARAFTLTCPGYRSSVTLRDRNATPGLPIVIGDRVLAEIGHRELMESWETAGTLTAGELAEMSRAAGERLADILADGLEYDDLAETVTDAAVLFLLAMRRKGIADPKRIPACMVMWNGQDGQEHVLMGA
jgi:hypothetical protein